VGRLERVMEPIPGDFADRQRGVAERLMAVDPPLTKAGKPHSGWGRALLKCAGLAAAGDWEALLAENLCGAALEEGGSFYSIEVPLEICAIFAEVRALARLAIGARLARQGRALGRLARLLCEAVERKQRELGAYGFGDITRQIGGPHPLCGREDLFYRLDARTEHILLDEFQDTSLAQWEALEPLMSELLSGYAGERAAVVVADPKQSIYAWRGGEPLLVRHVGDRYALREEGMHLSYRSSQVVLDGPTRCSSASRRTRCSAAIRSAGGWRRSGRAISPATPQRNRSRGTCGWWSAPRTRDGVVIARTSAAAWRNSWRSCGAMRPG
jgi:hypothetical protein